MPTTNFTNQVTLTDATWFDEIDTIAFACTGVAGTNDITATAPVSFSAYATGQLFRFVPVATNTGATTLNLTGLGAKNIFNNNVACLGGEIISGIPVVVYYDGTRFHLVNGLNTSFLQDSTPWTLYAVAGTNTITATMTPTLVAYKTGQRFTLTPVADNSGAVTINIDARGAKDIYSNGTTLSGSELRTGVPVQIVYDGTRFHLGSGGSGGAVANNCIYENALVVSANYTLTTGRNGHSVGPITVNGGVSVTVPGGQRWVIV